MRERGGVTSAPHKKASTRVTNAQKHLLLLLLLLLLLSLESWPLSRVDRVVKTKSQRRRDFSSCTVPSSPPRFCRLFRRRHLHACLSPGAATSPLFPLKESAAMCAARETEVRWMLQLGRKRKKESLFARPLFIWPFTQPPAIPNNEKDLQPFVNLASWNVFWLTRELYSFIPPAHPRRLLFLEYGAFGAWRARCMVRSFFLHRKNPLERELSNCFPTLWAASERRSVYFNHQINAFKRACICRRVNSKPASPKC